MTKKLKIVNIKDFGATKMMIPLKATSKINEKGELIKYRDYDSQNHDTEFTKIDDMVFGNTDRKKKNRKIKTKRRKYNKK